MTTSFHTALEQSILDVDVQRNVDWRTEPKAMYSRSQLRAAAGQQRGLQAPKGGACDSCGKGHGPFKTCVVLITDDGVAFEGACCSCAFGGNGNKCSLRKLPCSLSNYGFANVRAGKEDVLASWIADPLRKVNPDHPLLKKATTVSASVSLNVIRFFVSLFLTIVF